MNTTDPTQPLELEANNNETTKKLTGFQLHPENINREGSPKKNWRWADLYAEIAEEYRDIEKRDGTKEKMQVKRIVAEKVFSLALKGDMQAVKELADRMNGKSKETVEVDARITIPHVTVNTKPEEING